MVKAVADLSSFNGGEFSPHMDARTDFSKYPAAASRALNLLCLPQGGFMFRPGTRFVVETKTSSSKSALIPFGPAADQAYMLEMGASYMRVCRNQGQVVTDTVGTTISNGTFDSDLTDWTDRSTGSALISQSGGVMVLQAASDGYAWAEQAITVASADRSTVHVVRFTLSGAEGAIATCQVGTASLGYDLVQVDGLGIGTHTIAFTPGAATVRFQILIKESARFINVDNVEILSGEAIELATPYTAAQALALQVAQSADVLYLFHPDVAPYKIERRSDLSWSVVKVFVQDGPWDNVNPGTDLAVTNFFKDPSFESGISEWTVTGTGGQWDGSQHVLFFGGASSGTVTAEAAITTNDKDVTHVFHFQVVGGPKLSLTIGTTSGGTDIQASTDYTAGWYDVSFTPGATTFYIKFSGSPTSTSMPGLAGVFLYNSHANLLTASSKTWSATITASGDFRPFRATDVGRMIRLEHPGREPGWGIISAFTDDQTVSVRTYRDFASTAPIETWRLGSWSDTTGWPEAVVFHQQRLFAGNTTERPQTVWGSVSGDFENMRPDVWQGGAVDVTDTCALNFTLAAQRVSPIRWLLSGRRLLAGTASGQWVVSSQRAALSPTDFAAEQQTSIDSADVAALQIDESGIFVHRSEVAVYDIGYNFQSDSYQAADLTILADHILRAGVTWLVYQSVPYSFVWALRADGTLACLTYKRSQDVVGWTPVEIAGKNAVVEAIGVIPGADGSGQVYSSKGRDELWLLVKRTIDGSTKRYIEVMEGFYAGPNIAEYTTFSSWKAAQLSAQADAFYVDCGLSYTGSSTSTISGLDHLEGETVKVVVGGIVQSDKTVSNGSITLDSASGGKTVHVGLGYSWRYRSLKMAYGAQAGSAVTATKIINDVAPVLLDAAPFSYGVEVNHDADLYANPAYDTGTTLFTGEMPNLSTGGGYGSDPRIVLTGSQPLPWTMLSLVSGIKTNEQL